MIEHITLSPKVNLAAGTITIEEFSKIEGVQDDLARELAKRRAEWVINTRDKLVRDALICLGWRPPIEPAAVPDVEARVRIRANDPASSMKAAEKVASTAKKHSESILRALIDRDMTVKEIAAAIGITHVQVARRMGELQKAGLAVVVQTQSGHDLEREGCRVWRRANR